MQTKHYLDAMEASRLQITIKHLESTYIELNLCFRSKENTGKFVCVYSALEFYLGYETCGVYFFMQVLGRNGCLHHVGRY